MSILKETISERIKQAMRDKNKTELQALRAVKTAITNAETAEGAVALTEDDLLKIVSKQASQRRDALAIYEKQERADLAAVESAELAVIETLLPKGLTDEELQAAVKTYLTENGLSGMANMSVAVKGFNAAYVGRVDPKKVAPLIKAGLTA